MPDVIQLLNRDHRKVEQLFEEFEATQDLAIARQICEELTVHTEIEETVVYPRLEQIDRELEQEAEKEHDEAKGLIAQIERMTSSDTRLVELMTKLKEAVLHHVQEEETQAWPRLRDSLGGDELSRLGDRAELERGRLLGTTSRGTGGGQRTILIDLTKEELYEKAKAANIEGRSSMTKKELIDALQRRS